MILGHFLKAVAQILHMAIQIYIIIILIRAVISWVGNIPYSPFIQVLRKLTDPVFRLVYRTFPFTVVGGIDFSPVIVMVVLYFLDSFIYGVLIGYANRLIVGG